jgi:3-oxoacyl-[acyl-carrier-protein] synthase III
MVNIIVLTRDTSLFTYRHLNAKTSEDGMNEEVLSSTNGSTNFPPKKPAFSYIQMNGKEVFRFAVRCVPQSIEASLEEAGLTSSNIDWLLLHQVC